MTEHPTRCGVVSLLGLPNAGKSTLVNALVGQKVSIVSRKVQTTRARVRGIALHENTQIILLDTPGVFEPKKTMERAMVSAALSTIGEGDVVVHLVDASSKNPCYVNKIITEKLNPNQQCVLVLNKVDKIAKDTLLALSAEMNDSFPYAATFMVSALKENGLEGLLAFLAEHMPQGPWHFDEDQVTDIPMRMMAAEITREKLYDKLHQELPYAILVETESWEQFDNGDIKISQVVYVQRDTQKGIVLGKGGSQIKAIGQSAREDLQNLLQKNVHLKLFVKVKENWQERAEFYQMMGLEKPI